MLKIWWFFFISKESMFGLTYLAELSKLHKKLLKNTKIWVMLKVLNNFFSHTYAFLAYY